MLSANSTLNLTLGNYVLTHKDKKPLAGATTLANAVRVTPTEPIGVVGGRGGGPPPNIESHPALASCFS